MTKLEGLTKLLQTIPELELAILIGSQASQTATDQSDWDIAVRWQKYIDGLAGLELSKP